MLATLLACSFGMPGASAQEMPDHAAPVLLAQTDGTAAETLFEGEGVPMASGTASGAYLSAMVALAAWDMAVAADHLLVVLESDPGNGDLLRRTSRALVSAGRVDEALPIARGLAETAGSDSLVPLMLMVDAVDRGDLDGAGEAVSLLSATGYNRTLVSLLDAWLAAGRGAYDDAVGAIGPAEERDGLDGLRAHHTALIEALAGRPAAAEASFARAMEGWMGGYGAVRDHGAFLERQGRAEDAHAVYRDFIANNSDSRWIDAVRSTMDGSGKPAVLPGSVREGVARALHDIARVASDGNQPRLGLAFGFLGVHLVPDGDETLLLIGELLESRSRNVEAMAVWGRIADDSPLDWNARLQTAASLDDRGRTDQAIDMLRGMAGERPGEADALIALGDILRFHDRWNEAVDAYGEASARLGADAQGHWRLRYVQGIALERSGDWDRAEKEFVAALRIRPDNPFILNYLGYTWIDRGENLDEALDMILRAVERRPNDGYIIDSLGWAYFRLGRYDEAVAELERATEHVPADAVINDHLGDAYWMTGRQSEARFQWRRALSLGFDDEALAAVVETKLRSGLDSNGI